MKVGDIVQQGIKVAIMKGRSPSKTMGVVVEITEMSFPTKLAGWQKFLGRSVTVLWENGKLSENFAENSLDVVNQWDSYITSTRKRA
jgi:hypothetical protein